MQPHEPFDHAFLTGVLVDGPPREMHEPLVIGGDAVGLTFSCSGPCAFRNEMNASDDNLENRFRDQLSSSFQDSDRDGMIL